MKKGVYIILLILLVILLTALLVLNFNRNPETGERVELIGWGMLQPNASTITFNPTTQIFSAGFDNQAGTGIIITSIEASEKYSNTSCATAINGEAINSGVEIENNTGFKIEGICNAKPRKTGEPYQLEIQINFTALIGFINTEYTENGTITGKYD